MKFFKQTLILFLIFLTFSCSSKKNILYIQDHNLNLNKSTLTPLDYKILSGDILKVNIKSNNPISSEIIESSSQIYNQTRESLMFQGYLVDKEGDINIPEIGKVNVLNLSVQDVENAIKQKLLTEKILVDVNVSVKVLTWHFTVLGEVKLPGKYYFNEPYINILQALGMAGDLTINGQRDNVKIIRFIAEKYEVINIDLTNSEFLSEESFQIMPGDVILVDPNTSRVKNAGIIGNSGTLLSLLSFLLSSIIIINN